MIVATDAVAAIAAMILAFVAMVSGLHIAEEFLNLDNAGLKCFLGGLIITLSPLLGGKTAVIFGLFTGLVWGAFYFFIRLYFGW